MGKSERMSIQRIRIRNKENEGEHMEHFQLTRIETVCEALVMGLIILGYATIVSLNRSDFWSKCPIRLLIGCEWDVFPYISDSLLRANPYLIDSKKIGKHPAPKAKADKSRHLVGESVHKRN